MTKPLIVVLLCLALTALWQVARTAAAEAEPDARIIHELEVFLSECDAAQIQWLSEHQVFTRELKEDLERSLSQASDSSFYGKTRLQVTAMKELKGRLGETAYITLLRGAASRQPIEKREAIGVIRYRVFTDTQGREMKAELLRSANGAVVAALENGQEFAMPATSLIDADQEFIRQWIADSEANGTSALPEKGWADFKVKAGPALVSLPDFVPESYQDGTEAKSSAYLVNLYNRGETTIGTIKFRYYLFYDSYDFRAFRDKPGEFGDYIGGDISLDSIPKKSEIKFEINGPFPYFEKLKDVVENPDSASVPMVGFDPKNHSPTAGGAVDRIAAILKFIRDCQESRSFKQPKLTGIWIRAFIGAQPVAEFVSGKAAEKASEAAIESPAAAAEFDFQNGQ